MRFVGLPVVVANCTEEVFQVARVRLTRSGGQGAVREFAELLLKARGEWDALVEYRYLTVDQNDSDRHGWLVGVDRHVNENFRVGLGYNFTSFSDNLAELGYDHKGWFLNLTGTY